MLCRVQGHLKGDCKRSTRKVSPEERNKMKVCLCTGNHVGGHSGVTKTLQKLLLRFYWVNCSEDTKEWYLKCKLYSVRHGPQSKLRAPIKQYKVGSPFERIELDKPRTEYGNKYGVDKKVNFGLLQ